MTGIFTLDGDKLVAVKLVKGAAPSAFSLTVHDGVSWSIGRDDVASFGGAAWTRYT